MVKIVGRFSELGTNKNEIMMRLITSDNIVKALSNTQRNFLDIPTLNSTLYPDPTKDPATQCLNFLNDPTLLIYNQIFPYTKVPTTTDTAKTFITMKFGYRPTDTFFKISTIYFYVITHSSLVRTNYSVLRYDYLINEIDKLFNSQRGIGIGKLPFYEMSDFQVNDSWFGAYIGYKSTEFN